MLIVRSHRIHLRPTQAVAQHFACAAGCARQAYNWAVARTKERLDKGEKPTNKELKNEFNAIKREQFPWQYEVTKCAAEGAFTNFAKAKDNFFKRRAKFPRFHKKGVHDSFTVNNDKFRVDGQYVILPRVGRVRMSEQLRFTGKILSAVVSRKADRWYISIAVEFEIPDPTARENQAVGVDLGIKHFAVLSTGEKIEGPKALGQYLKRLKREQQRLSRMQKGSKRRWKQQVKVARIHMRVVAIRNDFLHKLSTHLVTQFNTVVIEDLAVKNMLRNRSLARRIQDASWGEFRRQLEYKAPVVGCRILVADRFFPSSKTCSNCSYKLDKLDLSVRTWICPSCGQVHDRDHNASRNLESLALG